MLAAIALVFFVARHRPAFLVSESAMPAMNLADDAQAARRRRSRCSVSALRWCRFTRKSARSPASTTCSRPTRSPIPRSMPRAGCTVEFDSNVRDNLPWTFRPLQTSVRMHPGELMQVDVRNTQQLERARSPGQAIPSYGPQLAAALFQEARVLLLHASRRCSRAKSRRMPVVFVIEDGLPEDVNTITLSYSFFEVEGAVEERRADADD